MNYGKNKYIIERYNIGVEERLKKICTYNIEPRIELEEVIVDPNYDNNQFDCIITYKIVGIDVPATQLEFALLPSR